MIQLQDQDQVQDIITNAVNMLHGDIGRPMPIEWLGCAVLVQTPDRAHNTISKAINMMNVICQNL